MKIKRWEWLFYTILAILISVTVWVCRQGQSWTALVTPIVLTIAAIIAYRQLQHAHHTRCARLLLEIQKWWTSSEMVEARQLLWEMENRRDRILQLYKAKDKNFIKIIRVAEFGESLGILVSRHYVEAKDIWLLFEDDWKQWYEDFGGVMDELQQINPSDTTFCNLKVLCEELDKIQD